MPFLSEIVGLDIVNGIAGLNVQNDDLSGQGLPEDLHASAKAQDERQGATFPNVGVRRRAAIFKLRVGKE